MILCFYNFFMFFSVIAFVSQCLHKCPTELANMEGERSFSALKSEKLPALISDAKSRL